MLKRPIWNHVWNAVETTLFPTARRSSLILIRIDRRYMAELLLELNECIFFEWLNNGRYMAELLIRRDLTILLLIKFDWLFKMFFLFLSRFQRLSVTLTEAAQQRRNFKNVKKIAILCNINWFRQCLHVGIVFI